MWGKLGVSASKTERESTLIFPIMFHFYSLIVCWVNFLGFPFFSFFIFFYLWEHRTWGLTSVCGRKRADCGPKNSSTVQIAARRKREHCLLCGPIQNKVYTQLLNKWPTATLQGYRFYFGQEWHRQIQALGLQKTYRSATEENPYLRSFFGLLFLNPDELEDFFLEYFTVCESTSNDVIHKFIDSVYKTLRTGQEVRFPRIFSVLRGLLFIKLPIKYEWLLNWRNGARIWVMRAQTNTN